MNLVSIFPPNAKVTRLLITVCLLQAAIFGSYFVVERGFPHVFLRKETVCTQENIVPTVNDDVDRNVIKRNDHAAGYYEDEQPQEKEMFSSPKYTEMDQVNSGILLHRQQEGNHTKASLSFQNHSSASKTTSTPGTSTLKVSQRSPKNTVTKRPEIRPINHNMNTIELKMQYQALKMSQGQERKLINIISKLKRPPFSDLFSLSDVKLDFMPLDARTKDSHPWYRLHNKMQRLLENPIYEKFAIGKVTFKRRIDLLIIVSTAPGRYERRQGIRETWWSSCISTARISVKCVFITDAKDPSTKDGKALQEEQEKYNDLAFQNLKGGVEFGTRFLFHMVWAMENYHFKYVMRMDDDYFLCLEKLMKEIPIPAINDFHWGFVHCEGKDLVWPDESIVLFSRNVIEQFLGQDPYKMLCHPQADQMIAVWRNELKMNFKYNGDPRLHHHPPASTVRHLKQRRNLCHSYIGLHGTYSNEMREFWSRRGSDQGLRSTNIFHNTIRCPYMNRLRWELIVASEFVYIPKLCIDNPVWDTNKAGKPGQMYIGREGKSGSGTDQDLRASSGKADEESSFLSASSSVSASAASASSADASAQIPIRKYESRVIKFVPTGHQVGFLRSRTVPRYPEEVKARKSRQRAWKVLF